MEIKLEIYSSVECESKIQQMVNLSWKVIGFSFDGTNYHVLFQEVK